MTHTAEPTQHDGGRVVVEFDQHSPSYRNRYPEISHELRSKCPVTWTESHASTCPEQAIVVEG
jgi:hypothetical protein